MNVDSHRRRRQSAGMRSRMSAPISNGARSDGEYSTAPSQHRSRDFAPNFPPMLGRQGQRAVSIVVSNRHPEVELRTLHPCILSGIITCGRLPSSSLGSGDRREVVYTTEPVYHDGPTHEIREETRGGFIYQLRGRRGMPMSRRLFLFISWSVPGTGSNCRCVIQVVEADHCAFPDEWLEVRGQFRRLTRQRMGSSGGVRIDRRRKDSTGGPVNAMSQGYSGDTMDSGAYSDGESIMSTSSVASKRQTPRCRERHRYILDEDRIAFTVVSYMEMIQDRVELRVDVVDEAFDGYSDGKSMAKRTSPIWLEPLGDDDDNGDQDSADEGMNGNNGAMYNHNEAADSNTNSMGGFDERQGSNIGSANGFNRESDPRTNSIASRMFRHVTVTIRNRHHGLMLAGPHMDMRRGRSQNTPDSSIMAGSKDMTCVFRSGVLGASGIKGCLIYQIIPRAVVETMSIVQRQFLVIVWDVHSSLSSDSKSRKDSSRASGRRLRAFVFTVDRPRFPHDRAERERFFRVVYGELAKATDGAYRGARWCGRIGEECYTCRVKPLFSEGGDGRLMPTGIVAEFRPMKSHRLSGRWPIFVPPELFVFQSSTAALKVREVVGQHNITADSEKRAPNSVMVVLLENRHSSISLNLRSHDANIYIGERMQGLAGQLHLDEYDVATLLLDRIHLRQKNALFGKQRTVFGYTVYELSDTTTRHMPSHPHESQQFQNQRQQRQLRQHSQSNPQYNSSMASKSNASLMTTNTTTTMTGGPSLPIKESRFLLIGWIKLSGRNIKFAVTVFRAVSSVDQVPNGLPESPALRQYLYRTFISYAHGNTGIWEQSTDSGRPYKSQQMPIAPSNASASSLLLSATPAQPAWLQGLSYSSYLGIGQTPVLSVQLFEADNVPKSPAHDTYPKVDNAHGGLRLINGRFFSVGSQCVAEMERHLDPGDKSTGIYTPDFTGRAAAAASQSIGVICFQVVDTGSNLLQYSPHVIISWCIGGEAGKESLQFHADILQDRDVGYDGRQGALHAPNIYNQVVSSSLSKLSNRDDGNDDGNDEATVTGTATGEWIMECTALLDVRIPYRISTRVWMSEAGQLCYSVIVSGKGSRSARRSSASSTHSQAMSMTAARLRKGSMPSLSASQLATTAQWRTSTMSTSTAITTMTMNTEVSRSNMPITNRLSDRTSMGSQYNAIYGMRGASTTDPSLVLPKMPIVSQLSIHHLPPPPLPTSLSIRISILNRISSVEFCTPPTTAFPVKAILPKDSVDFTIDLPLAKEQYTTADSNDNTIKAAALKGCIMYEVKEMVANTDESANKIPDGTFFAIGWSIEPRGQRQFFASIAHIPGVMATVNMRSQKSSPQVRRIIDLLVADDKGRTQLFTQLAHTRFKSAGQSMRQAYMLPCGTSVGVAASMTPDEHISMDVVLWPASEAVGSPKLTSEITSPVSPPSPPLPEVRQVKEHSNITSPVSPPPPLPPPRRRPPMSSPPALPPPASESKPILMPSLSTHNRLRAISDVSDTSLPSEMPPAVPRPILPPPPVPEESTPLSSFKILLCIEQRHRQVHLCRLHERMVHGVCEKAPLATMMLGQDSLSTYCTDRINLPDKGNAAIEGSIVYGFTSAASTFGIGGHCLSIRWRVNGEEKSKGSAYSVAVFRLDLEAMPEDDMDWDYLLDTMHEHDDWQTTGTNTTRYYLFADDSRRLALHANMFIEPMVVARVELAEWTDVDLEAKSDEIEPMYPLSARELLLNSQMNDADGLMASLPASVNMTVQLTLDNLHPTFSLKSGQLLVVDGQQVQRPPTVVPSGQSINGRFSISWAMPDFPDGKELADRPHLVVGWRVDGGSLTHVDIFFARIIGEALTQEIIHLWTSKLATPSDPMVVANKDRSFIELAGNGLMPANAQSKERRLLADGRILLTHASLTSVEVASDVDTDDTNNNQQHRVPSVHLALKVQLSREPSRASIIGEWSLGSSPKAS
ncbi:hypothetical protein BDF19DRAFT_437435 [Syncephalis fuscata]|nr:hypothetical protein BDF19DRAFT_437435 [Syncephalis fuscata]